MRKGKKDIDGLALTISEVYAAADGGQLDNESLYARVAAAAGIDKAELDAVSPIGKAGTPRSPIKRKIRWFQQTLREARLIERVPGTRGVWRLSDVVGKDLDQATTGVKLIAFCTDLGIAVWGRCQDVFKSFGEPISLIITSPPYPLRKARAYGGINDEVAYIDFICTALERVIRSLEPGGTLVLNISQDIFLPGSPARSLYVERLVLALHDRLGLSMLARVPWINYSKPPGPTYWACVNRIHLSSAWEPLYVFTNDPMRVRADNRRVLEQHTAKHLELIASGGAQRTAVYGDGAYRLRPDSFSNVTEGRIPRNVLERGHSCADTLAYRKEAKKLGLPLHGAIQPTSIADFFIRYLTLPDDLIADPFGGTIKTGLAAERLGRRWIVSEVISNYLRGAAGLFSDFNGFDMPSGYSLR
jgi:site-specific DNA-methyltransferase (cytosine-N4-specific)